MLPHFYFSVLSLLSLITKFMTSLRGHRQGYTFGIPTSGEGMRGGLVGVVGEAEAEKEGSTEEQDTRRENER